MSQPVDNPILLDVPEQLATERLVLRIPRPGDGPLIWAAVAESQVELAPYMPWAYPRATEAGCETFCRQAASAFFARQQFSYMLLLAGTDTCVGTCGVPRLRWEVPSFEIGYWLRTPFSGKGLMAEAVAVIERLCFDVLHAARVEIRCDARNVRSRRVAERAGYPLEGILKQEERAPSGELRDMCVYAKVTLVAPVTGNVLHERSSF